MGSFTGLNDNNELFVYELSADEELDSFIYNMLEKNDIQGLLEVSFSQFDETRKLNYKTEGYTKLDKSVLTEFDRDSAMKLICDIAGAGEDADEYMLRASSIVWDEEYLFADKASKKVKLVCLPIKNDPYEKNVKDFFKELLVCLKLDNAEAEGYPEKVWEYLGRGSRFSFAEFMKIAEEYLNGNTELLVKEKKGAAAPVPVSSVVPQKIDLSSAPKPANAAKPSADPGMNRPAMGGFGKPQKTFGKDGAFGTQGVGLNHMPPKPAQPAQPVKDEKEEKKGLFGKLFGSKKNDKEQPVKAESQPSGIPTLAPRSKNDNKQSVRNSEPVKPVKSKEDYIAAPNRSGSLSSKHEETDIVTGVNAATPAAAYLVHIRTGMRIVISKPNFTIGKEKGMVDYCVTDNNTVSRKHARIFWNGSEYCVEDTNSKNHTYVNGDMLSSNVPRKLENGARIRCSNEEFSFFMN